MPLHWLFPTPVLQVDLEPDPQTAKSMLQQLAQFDRDVFQHAEFCDRNNLTGDLLGHAGLDQLHRMEAFQWLNMQLASHVSQLLSSLLGPEHQLMVHIQKAWPVVCASNGGTIELHSHRNAQLSAVFYVQTEPGNATGELEFQAPDDYFSHVMAIPYSEAAVSGGVFAPKTNRLLLFPSDLRHRVMPYEGSRARYSVSYDLAITTAPGQGKEMRMPHPMDWVPLCEPGSA
ncbi:MAG: TIGR02466 family protein [Cyanobacteriota bacterium]|nr:TIGR02466 family protein [Cyanobacteriota bacterium]